MMNGEASIKDRAKKLAKMCRKTPGPCPITGHIADRRGISEKFAFSCPFMPDTDCYRIKTKHWYDFLSLLYTTPLFQTITEHANDSEN